MTRGPLSPGVYWRRRVFVLGVVAALLLILVNLVRGNDGTADAGRTQATTVAGEATTTPTTEATSAAPTTGNGKGKGKGKKDDAPTAPTTPVYTPPPAPVLVDPVGSCADDDIAVSPVVTGAVAARAVTVTLRLRTITSEACTWPISANHLALKISQDGEDVWSSRECARQVPTDSVVVRQAVTSTYELTWNARESDAGCPRFSELADPGDYDIEVAAYGGEPASSSFTLAPQPTVEPDAPLAPVAPPTTGGADDKPGKKKNKNKNQRD